MEQIQKTKIMQKDIVILPFPFTDIDGYKVRPAVVVSNEYFNKTRADRIMVPLTSVIKEDNFSIAISQKDLSDGELLTQSRARADRLFCIDKERIITKIGSIGNKPFEEIKAKIQALF